MSQYCKIIEDTFIYGEPVAKGEKLEVDEPTFKQLVTCKKCVACERPEDAPVADPKPKFTRTKNADKDKE